MTWVKELQNDTVAEAVEQEGEEEALAQEVAVALSPLDFHSEKLTKHSERRKRET